MMNLAWFESNFSSIESVEYFIEAMGDAIEEYVVEETENGFLLTWAEDADYNEE